MLLHSQTNPDSGAARTLTLFLGALLMFCTTSCAKRSHPSLIAEPPVSIAHSQTSNTSALQRININVASPKELEALPGIGKGLAERIIEHREKYGPFRRAEHLMMVRGISETRFRALRHLVTVE
jgi:competence ComEA-like helix-hairpin-helix protein